MIINYPLYRFFILLILVISSISACNFKQQDNNLLRVDIGAELSSLDPALAEDGSSYRVVNDLFAGLIDFDQKNHPIAGMAYKWIISSDGKTYTFYLRDQLKFSDGSLITADDVIYSWRRLVDPKTGSAYAFLLKDIVGAKLITQGLASPINLGVSAPQKNIIVVHLTRPSNGFLYYLSMPNTYVVSSKIINKYGNVWTDPAHMVSSGAYKLVNHVLNSYILVTKNLQFYDHSQVMITNIKYFPYVDNNTSLANYKTHALDTTWQYIPQNLYPSLSIKYGQQLHLWQWERTDFLHLNLKDAKLANNLKLRQALSLAVDRSALTDKILGLKQIPLYSLITPTIANGHYADLKYQWSTWPRARQISTAQRLYREAGYNINHPLTISIKYKNSGLTKKAILAVAAMWHDVLGVEVITEAMELKVLLSAMHNGDYEIASKGGWGADYDLVDTYVPLYLCNNYNNNSGYCNPQYDHLIELAENNLNPHIQQQLYKKAFKIALNDYPVIPLFEPSHQRLVNLRILNYQVEQNYLDNVQSKWLRFKS